MKHPISVVLPCHLPVSCDSVEVDKNEEPETNSNGDDLYPKRK